MCLGGVGAEDIAVPIRTAISEIEAGNILEALSTLERERELQDKSLQVLHQQLEMERSRAAAPANAG